MAPGEVPGSWRAESMYGVLRRWASDRPQDCAYRFLSDGEAVTESLTFAELLLAADRVARLLDAGAGSSKCALLVFPPGLSFIVGLIGCFAAGVPAVPVAPPRRREPPARLRKLLHLAEPALILTTDCLAGQLADLLGSDVDRRQIHVIDRGGVTDDQDAASPLPVALSSDDIALVQFTSGSTTEPKGVAVTHAQLLANQRMIQSAFEHDDATTVVGWLPLFHDMGLIGNVLQPLYLGRPCVLMPPGAFLQRPVRWLEAISRFGATTSGAPNFAYDLCAQRIPRGAEESLDLSSWRVAYCGSETVRADTIDAFSAQFGRRGFQRRAFLPCYGLAEGTLLVTGGPGPGNFGVRSLRAEALRRGKLEDEPDGVRIVGCGRPPHGTKVRIVVSGADAGEDRIGEVWVSGPSRASGYWQDPNLTQRLFGARLNGDPNPYLRTGDVGFLHDKELFLVGRSKDVIIIRGRNHQPHDIEHTAQRSHCALAAGRGAAFGIDDEGAERLVLVQEVTRAALRGADLGAVGRAVREAIAVTHGLELSDLLLVRPQTVPRTTSGKVRRVATREAYLEGSLRASVLDPPSAPIDVVGPVTPEPPSEEPQAQVERVEQVLSWLRTYAERRIDSRLMDERRSLPPSVVLDFGRRGLFGLEAPQAHGGLALSRRGALRVLEQLGAIDQTLALLVGVHNELGLRPICRHATGALRQELVPDLVSGRGLASFALTEPGAGSNPRAITSRADPTGSGGWHLRGQKAWTGLGAWAHALNVFVRAPGDGSRGAALTGFVVRQHSPGLRHGPEALTMGMRAIVQNTVHLEGVPVGRAELLGELGDGLAIAQEAMMAGRLAIAASALGGMKRCAQLMSRYAEQRTIATGRLLDNPATIARLDELVSATAALESLITHMASRVDEGGEVPPEVYACVKILGPELLGWATDGLMQLLGGRGYVESNVAPQLYRDARVLRIFEGPTEAMRDFLGARLANSPDTIVAYAETVLGSPLTKSRLAALHDRRERAPRGRLGDAVAFAILLAAVEAAYPRAADATLAWATARFEAASDAAMRDTEHRSVASIVRAISAFRSDIGDAMLRAPGVDSEVDALLQPKGGASAVRSGSASAAERLARPEPTASGTTHDAQSMTSEGPGWTSLEVRDWILKWLAARLHVALTPQDGRRTFDELGVDSLTAVELAADLAEWIQSPLEDTILWDYSTPEALARYLTATPDRDVEGNTKDMDPWIELEALERRLGRRDVD